MRYALVIPGWFPSDENFLAGDFIERHAKAASQYFPVKVLYVVKTYRLPFGKTRLEQKRISGNYEIFIYYYSAGFRLGIVGKMASAALQSVCFYRGFKKLIGLYGLPSLIHAHVLVKHAWFALRIARQYHIPLIASEQWTGYLPEARGEFAALSMLQKRTIGKVFKHAFMVTTVSEYLFQKIRDRFYVKDHVVIPNLVDMSIFQPADERNDVVTFIHISTLSPQKNADEMLAACRILKEQGVNFKLNLVAPEDRLFLRKVWDYQLQEHISFYPEVPQQQLAALVATADALILYSNYETFGCVIVEANACGVPVIVSNFPVFEENVVEGITGFKVPLHDPSALADRMLKIINKQHRFDKEGIIRITREKYSVEVIGKQFADVYSQYAKPE